jgi:ribosome-associated toxin RatA of RatAB toxin-antitoxin module
MSKNIVYGIVAVVVVVGGFVAFKAIQLQREAAKWENVKEIVEESFERSDDLSKTRFVAVVAAPVDKVREALWDVEDSAQMVENIKHSKMVKQEANKKQVEIHLQALNLPLQQYVMEFTLHADENRITFVTVESSLQHLEGSYQLEPSPDGTKTRVEYHSTAKDKVRVPFPSSVLESANKETFVNTIRGVNKAVHAAG